MTGAPAAVRWWQRRGGTMQRLVRALCIVAVALGGHAAIAAGVSQDQLTAVNKAADAFMALAKDSYKTGTPPRQSDAAVKALLDTLFATGDLAPVPFANLDKLDDWMTRVAAIGDVYVFAGTGVADPAKLTKPDAKLQQKMVQNQVTYAPELGRQADAVMQLAGAIIDCIATELAAHPDEFNAPQAKQGLASERSGTAQMLGTVIGTFATKGLDPGWIKDRLTVLNAIAPSAAKFLTTDDRKRLRDEATQIAGMIADPAVKSGLAAFAKTIAP
jgi:hypothetical protein